MIILNESDFDTFCKWIDTKTVQYNNKEYKVVGYKAGNITLKEI